VSPSTSSFTRSAARRTGIRGHPRNGVVRVVRTDISRPRRHDVMACDSKSHVASRDPRAREEQLATIARPEVLLNQERKRAEMSEASAKYAWKLAVWGSPRRIEGATRHEH
jgi:hypothetical protein